MSGGGIGSVLGGIAGTFLGGQTALGASIGGALGSAVSGGGGSNSNVSSNSTTSTPQTPAWLQPALQQQLTNATNIQNTPYQPYTGNMVAGFNTDEQNSFNTVNGLQGQAQPYQQQGLNTLGQVQNEGLNGLNSQTIQNNMNPYIQDVVNTSTQNQLQQYSLEKQALAGQQANIGAFGGSRTAIGEQQLSKNFDQQLATNNANLYAGAFQSAQGATQQGLATAGQTANQSVYGANQMEQTGLQGAQAQLNQGQLQQQNVQQGLNWNYQQFQNQLAYPMQQATNYQSLTGPLIAGQTGQSGYSYGVNTAPNSGQTGAYLGAASTIYGAQQNGSLAGVDNAAGYYNPYSSGSYTNPNMSAYNQPINASQQAYLAETGGGSNPLAQGGVVPTYAKGGLINHSGLNLGLGASGPPMARALPVHHNQAYTYAQGGKIDPRHPLNNSYIMPESDTYGYRPARHFYDQGGKVFSSTMHGVKYHNDSGCSYADGGIAHYLCGGVAIPKSRYADGDQVQNTVDPNEDPSMNGMDLSGSPAVGGVPSDSGIMIKPGGKVSILHQGTELPITGKSKTLVLDKAGSASALKKLMNDPNFVKNAVKGSLLHEMTAKMNNPAPNGVNSSNQIGMAQGGKVAHYDDGGSVGDWIGSGLNSIADGISNAWKNPATQAMMKGFSPTLSDAGNPDTTYRVGLPDTPIKMNTQNQPLPGSNVDPVQQEFEAARAKQMSQGIDSPMSGNDLLNDIQGRNPPVLPAHGEQEDPEVAKAADGMFQGATGIDPNKLSSDPDAAMKQMNQQLFKQTQDSYNNMKQYSKGAPWLAAGAKMLESSGVPAARALGQGVGAFNEQTMGQSKELSDMAQRQLATNMEQQRTAVQMKMMQLAYQKNAENAPLRQAKLQEIQNKVQMNPQYAAAYTKNIQTLMTTPDYINSVGDPDAMARLKLQAADMADAATGRAPTAPIAKPTTGSSVK